MLTKNNFVGIYMYVYQLMYTYICEHEHTNIYDSYRYPRYVPAMVYKSVRISERRECNRMETRVGSR